MGESKSSKEREIAIIGLGSIGIRHLEALVELGYTNFVALRTQKGSKKLPEHLIKYVKNVTSVEKLQSADFFIISNPTSLHEKTLNDILSFQKPIFIEKPLSDQVIKDVKLLKNIRGFEAKIQIGFCLRFHPVIKRVKEIINKGSLGSIYFSEIKCGQYLPLWHPYTDYRKEYFSRKDLGGGAIRTLSHEIDLSQFFFGNPKSIKANIDRVSDLEIDVDDFSQIMMKYDDKKSLIVVDFLQKKVFRTGVIYGSNYDLHYDVMNNKILIYNDRGELEKQEDIQQEDMYVNQMDCFVNNTVKYYATIQESIEQLKIIDIADKISKQVNWVKI